MLSPLQQKSVMQEPMSVACMLNITIFAAILEGNGIKPYHSISSYVIVTVAIPLYNRKKQKKKSSNGNSTQTLDSCPIPVI